MHKTGFKNLSKHGHCKILCDHFNNGGYKDDDYHVQMILKFDINRRNQRWAIDGYKTQIKKTKETKWILKLRKLIL